MALTPRDEERIRHIVVQELTILARVIGGARHATSYALDSLRAAQNREAEQRRDRP